MDNYLERLKDFKIPAETVGMKQSKNHRLLIALLVSFVFFFSNLVPRQVQAQSLAIDPLEAAIGGYDEESSAAFRAKCNAVAKQVATYATAAIGIMADSAYSCVKELFKGAWSSTGGVATGALEETGETIGSTAGCLATGGLGQCGKDLADKVAKTASYVTNLVGQLRSSFLNLTSQQIVDLTCNVLGMMGPYALATIASGGAAVGTLGLGIARVISVLQKLSTLGPIETVLKVANLPMELLTKLSSATLDRVVALLGKDASMGPKVKEALMSCGI